MHVALGDAAPDLYCCKYLPTVWTVWECAKCWLLHPPPGEQFPCQGNKLVIDPSGLPLGKLGSEGRLAVDRPGSEGKLGSEGRLAVDRLGSEGKLLVDRLGKPPDGGVRLNVPEAPPVPAEPEKEPSEPSGPLNFPDTEPPLVETSLLTEPPVPSGPLNLPDTEPPLGLSEEWLVKLPVPLGPERLVALEAVILDEFTLLVKLPPEPFGPFTVEVKPPPLGLRFEF